MKQKLLTFGMLLGTMLLGSLSANAWTFDFETLTGGPESIKEYEGKYSPVSTPSAIGTDGTIYQTGLYDDMVVIGDFILENIATSAYIAAIDPTTQTAKWAICLRGASHITPILADDSYVYVAGTYADDVIFGSNDDNEQTIHGTELSHDYANTFVAKYTTAGVLVSVLPVIPVLANAETYEDKDLSVTPTALALRAGKLYLSFSYKGGYKVGTHTINGTVQNTQSKTTCICLGVLAIPSDNFTSAVKVLDVKGIAATCNAGHGPRSICLTATDNSVEIATFLTGKCDYDFAGWTGSSKTRYEYKYSATSDEAGMVFVRLTDAGHTEYKAPAASADNFVASYTRNTIRNMYVEGKNLYLSGNLGTALPLKPTLQSLLFTDQFAACVNLETYETNWAVTTRAKNEDMPTMDDKYRETIGAALSNGNYVVIGTTNFSCGMGGTKTDFDAKAAVGSDYDVCLGVSANSSALVVATKSTNGSQLSADEPMPSRLDTPETEVEAVPQAIFSIDGSQRPTLQQGVNIIKYSNGAVKKQILK